MSVYLSRLIYSETAEPITMKFGENMWSPYLSQVTQSSAKFKEGAFYTCERELCIFFKEYAHVGGISLLFRVLMVHDVSRSWNLGNLRKYYWRGSWGMLLNCIK